MGVTGVIVNKKHKVAKFEITLIKRAANVGMNTFERARSTGKRNPRKRGTFDVGDRTDIAVKRVRV
jgi:hypothetical protein